MSRTKSGFVTLCQQLLALGVVLAGLVPAAGVVSLDIVRQGPDGAAPAPYRGALTAYVREAQHSSVVPTAPVDPTVREIPLTAPRFGRVAPGSLQARVSERRTGDGLARVVTSAPEKVTGYGAVGVTWAHGETVPDTELGFRLRYRTAGSWSDWTTLPYHDDHGPDPDSAEGRHARPGTDPFLVGKVDDVQVQAVADPGAPVPDDLTLAVIDPGHAAASAPERAAIDTATMDGDDGSDSVQNLPIAPAGPDPATSTGGSDAATPAAAIFTPKPVIYSRAQWGADESMRDASALHYYEVHAGFVHHTVNANDYTRAEVPGIIRSIYAYHVKSRGWSDIGYNFLVDRFGRVWEGRYGGVDRPVVGAHTLNYNDYAFAMSAIGNYDVKEPSQAMVEAYGTLFAWKLSLHGVDAASTSQQVGPTVFQAINGHRDAASTACPGRYLYAKIPEIRQLAAQAQRGWAGRELESNLAGSPYPDIVARRTSDQHLVIVPTNGISGFKKPRPEPGDWSAVTRADLSPDLTGDGAPDLVTTTSSGAVELHAGDGQGGFSPDSRPMGGFAGHDLVTAIGDVDGDGRPDVVARATDADRLDLYLGASTTSGRRVSFASKRKLGTTWGQVRDIAAAGDLDGDGLDDLVYVDDQGALAWRRSNGSGFGAPQEIPTSGPVDSVTGLGDVTGDGRADLLVRLQDGTASVLPGHGDGTFGAPRGPYGSLARAGRLTAADVAGGALADVLAWDGSRMRLYVNNQHTDAGTPIDTGVAAGGANLVLSAGDWDRDGYGDVITRAAGNGNLYLRRGDGAGHLGPATLLAKGFGGVQLLAAVGDMTGDGWPDLMGQPKGGAMRIYPGRGTDGLAPSYVAHSAIKAGRQIPVGTFDGDGAPDSLFRSGSSLTLYPGNGPGGLTNPQKLGLDVSPYDWVIGTSSPWLGRFPALVVRSRDTGVLSVIPRTAQGFGPARVIGDGMEAYDLAG